MSSNDKSCCRNCAVLKAQLEQQEDTAARYLKFIQSQNELIQFLSQNKSSLETSSPRRQFSQYAYEQNLTNYNGSDAYDQSIRRARGKQIQMTKDCRAFIGSITSDIDKDSLKHCLEEAFGPACAFADFASPTAYHNAVSEGAVLVNGIALSVERVRKPKPRK
ncbi:6104_t:CDS:2 [Funneliformis geosporum]|uniref:18853_t:CDS:1 n=1 Tax=Funneliformis geosporum TaxID=1117311 RepID=A0A9W4WQL9_9GLOM|nr:18853_t:CDS:2 [Funneliformis geosporum]CAI2180617.1 6104_t:CDS:2 [Funneliformis geosporum]